MSEELPEGENMNRTASGLTTRRGKIDELDIGLYYKRARACELTFGDSTFHRDRFARLQRY